MASALEHAVSLHQAGRWAEAEEAYRRILKDDPAQPDALHLLGVLFHQAGRSDLAAAMIRRAIEIRPGVAFFHNNLGEALRVGRDYEQALAQYEKAIALKADYADAWVNLGTVYQSQGKFDQAVARFRRAISIHPGHAGAYVNLGAALHALGRLDEASSAAHQAVELDPANAWGWNNLGVILQELADHVAAREAFDRAIQAMPGYRDAQSNRLLNLHYDRGDQAEALFEEHQRWGGSIAATEHRAIPRAHGRIRLGYVSADFWSHPVGWFIEPLIEAHDREQFELFCYSSGRRSDALTRRLAAQVNWREIGQLNDEQAVELIRKDGIDVLVDLSGHTAGNRLGVFAQRAAPVQVTYLGYPNTTGLKQIDYRITDALCDPPGMERCHTEKLLRLDGGFLCYRPAERLPEPSAQPEALPGPVTFGSFNNFAKVTQEMLETWAQILMAVEGSRLVLKAKALGAPSARERVMRALGAQGVDPGRVRLLAQVPSHRQHLGLYGQIDVALDTYPYCGTTTTCEAMWMGVPVITRAGPSHVSRVGLSLVTAVGHAAWAAKDREEYVRLAAELAANRPRLAELRLILRGEMERSPLCSPQRLAREMEKALLACLRR